MKFEVLKSRFNTSKIDAHQITYTDKCVCTFGLVSYHFVCAASQCAHAYRYDRQIDLVVGRGPVRPSHHPAPNLTIMPDHNAVGIRYQPKRHERRETGIVRSCTASLCVSKTDPAETPAPAVDTQPSSVPHQTAIPCEYVFLHIIVQVVVTLLVSLRRGRARVRHGPAPKRRGVVVVVVVVEVGQTVSQSAPMCQNIFSFRVGGRGSAWVSSEQSVVPHQDREHRTLPATLPWSSLMQNGIFFSSLHTCGIT